ncbi:hypothetical protein F503_02558 [Ophiostoma piceae UAMH 11346]|uniref:C3H1-type domain-containing protein n=1 Tax=Ophiostoma piceae (strain UAMH 11346) TaxID=1262450 RepID=S3CZM2_OPHP1|nr:hypothetical protein F503_02558 [Ophiostoma piceae UAMH 11346]
MSASSSSTPWKRKPRKRPCGLLYNTGQCTEADCKFSHEQRDIKSWRFGSGSSRPCRYGPACDHFTARMCIYSHPSSPLSPNYRNKNSKHFTHRISTPERQKQMLDGLALAHSLHALSTTSCGPVSILEGEQEHLTIRNEHVLASYNKLGDNKIAVPGFPQKFVPPTENLIVELDADENKDPWDSKNSTAIRRTYPSYTHSLEPLVRAVQYMAPTHYSKVESADIVANAGSLYRLFHYLSSHASAAHRFDLEWRPNSGGGGTLLMQQWNDDPDHKVSYGRGNNFAQKTCHYPDEVPDFIETSFTHHRVVSYDVGSLHIVIHCEADGFYEPADVADDESADVEMADACLPTPPSTPCSTFSMPIPYTSAAHRLPPLTSPRRMPTPPMSPPMSPRLMSPPSMGSRFAILDNDEGNDDAGDGEDDNVEPVTHHTGTLDITYHPSTRTISSANMVEIKTYSKTRNKQLVISPEPQLYFGRTRQLYKAGHLSGCFEVKGDGADEQVQDMTETLQQWEQEHQDVLSRMHSVLLHVRKLASDMAAEGHTKLCLVCPGPMDSATVPMQIYIRNDATSFLPVGL